MSIATDIIERIDFDSGVGINYKAVSDWYDGSAITDSKLDGDIFRKKGDTYYQKTIDKNTLLKINTIADLRNQNGYYEGQEVLLLGYYDSGDKSTVTYKFTVDNFDTYIDNGGNIIKSSRGTWIANLEIDVNLKHFGVRGDGINDDTENIQNCINYLSTIKGGALTGIPDGIHVITNKLDFSVLANEHVNYNIDFLGAEFIWHGPQTLDNSVFYLLNNKLVSISNFRITCNVDNVISTHIKGIFIDSLQPDGADLLRFYNFKIKLASIGVSLGSVGAAQNRVSDSTFSSFLIEGCDIGIQSNSTNVDSTIFTNGQLTGCRFAFNFERSGFNKIDTCIGYGCDMFIRINGPIGPLTIINSQSEPFTSTLGKFLYRINYTLADRSPITLLNCNIDEDILMDYDSGLGSQRQILNINGGYFSKLSVLAPDTIINVIGATQFTGSDIELIGENSKLFNNGSSIVNVTDTSNGYRLVSPLDGSFTPIISGTTTAGSATYSQQVGSFTRLADLCYFQIRLMWTGGTGTGDLKLSGLPFTAKNNILYGYAIPSIATLNATTRTSNTNVVSLVTPDTNEIKFYEININTNTTTPLAYSNSGEILISGWYKSN